jgi:16S rRNA pseudouridine516 synthase
MFQFVQAKVIDLKRVAIGSLQLDPSLEQGDYRELTPKEIRLIFQPSKR